MWAGYAKRVLLTELQRQVGGGASGDGCADRRQVMSLLKRIGDVAKAVAADIAEPVKVASDEWFCRHCYNKGCHSTHKINQKCPC